MHRTAARFALCALLCVALAPSARATTLATWGDFTSNVPVAGVPRTVALGGGSSVDVTVTTGGSQGISGADLDAVGASQTGLDYDHLRCFGIFNGGGSGTVTTTIVFSNFQIGSRHQSGLLFVGAVNGQSSPILLSSSLAGAVESWAQVGSTFDLDVNNAWPIAWSPAGGQLTTDAEVGNDSRGIVLDAGDLRQYGSITIDLNHHLNDGILFSIGERATAATGVEAPAGARGTWLAEPLPRPAREEAAIRFGLARNGRAELAVFDLSGRRVALLAGGVLEAGEHLARWDLRDSAGRPAAAGVYLVRLRTGEASLTRRIVRIR